MCRITHGTTGSWAQAPDNCPSPCSWINMCVISIIALPLRAVKKAPESFPWRCACCFNRRCSANTSTLTWLRKFSHSHAIYKMKLIYPQTLPGSAISKLYIYIIAISMWSQLWHLLFLYEHTELLCCYTYFMFLIFKSCLIFYCSGTGRNLAILVLIFFFW